MTEKISESENETSFAEGWIREGLRIENRHDEDFVQRVLAARDGYEAARTRQAMLKHWKTAGLAAAACIALSSVVFFTATPEAVAIASVRDVSGVVTIERFQGGRADSAAAGSALYPGDRLVCDDGASVIADYTDGSSINLEGAFQFDGSSLRSGRAVCSFADQNFETPHGAGRAQDAVFELFVDESQTKIRTLEGSVRVWGAGNLDEWAPVAAGYGATVKPGASLIARSFNIEDVEPGDVVWAQEFDTQFRERGSVEGTLVAMREHGALVTAIQSIPVEPIHHSEGFEPEEWVSLELFSRKALFGLPDEPEVEIRIRAERAGRIAVAMSHAEPEFKTEHVITEPFEIEAGWNRLTLNASEFIAFKESRPIEFGQEIRALTIWSWESGAIAVDRIQVRRAK